MGATTRSLPSEQVSAYLNGAGRPYTHWFNLDLSTLRRHHRAEFDWARGTLADVARVEDVNAEGVPARLYNSINAPQGVLVWFHGGGWQIGGLDEHDELCHALAHHGHCAVLSVDYRLAPEHKFPSAVDDASQATRWAADRYRSVAVGGDSAGGNLASVMALRARDAGMQLALQLLIYPVVDHRPDHDAYTHFAEHYAGFNNDPTFGEYFCQLIADCWQKYIPETALRAHPDASPLRAQSHSGVAPALILVAEHDLLRSENIEYAERLRASGVPTQLEYYPGQVHAFYPFIGLLEDARRAVGQSAAALREAFTGHTGTA